VILYPAIDVRGGHAVRLLRGDYAQETRYDADPVDAATRWETQGARYLHVVDLDGARDGSPVNLDAIRRIAAAVECPIQVGGGLRDADAVAATLGAGAERVVIGTAAHRDPAFLEAMLAAHGDRIVVAVDARGGTVALSGWTEAGDVEPAAAVAALGRSGVSRFLFTPIEVDGTMEGPGTDDLRRVAEATEAALIYSGGIGNLSDLHRLAVLAPANVEGVVVGRALYEARFTVAEGEAALSRD
jgi:phosphoribosylformimino-5-aminoimidazole carboxamide ribotide isomerase